MPMLLKAKASTEAVLLRLKEEHKSRHVSGHRFLPHAANR